AGLIEVTPESVRDWNREVLAGHRRLLGAGLAGPRPRWGDLMAKLLSFHLQGGRETRERIAAAAPAGAFPRPSRVRDLLTNHESPSEHERLALARYAGLD